VDHLEHLISKVNRVNFEINSVLPSLLLVFVEKVLTCLFTPPPSRQLSVMGWPECLMGWPIWNGKIWDGPCAFGSV
jgi:hypothetical protein